MPSASLQRRYLVERSTGLHGHPILVQRWPVQDRPASNQSPSGFGMKLSGHQLPGEVELGLLTLMLGVKMRRIVFLVEHSHDDAKEHRDNRHPRV